MAGASPEAIAFARESHPAYPHPPQLLPGRHSLMATSLSSTSTSNTYPATPSKIPITRPVTPTMAAAIIIPVIILYCHLLY